MSIPHISTCLRDFYKDPKYILPLIDNSDPELHSSENSEAYQDQLLMEIQTAAGAISPDDFETGSLDVQVTPHNLFESPNSGAVVLIEAPAGMGKSTLLRRMAHLWATQQLWPNQFTYVFLLQLRVLNSYMNWKDTIPGDDMLVKTICHCCLSESRQPRRNRREMPNQLIKILESSDPEKILFLLDGYDEIINIKELIRPIKDLPYDGYKVVVTSRHNVDRLWKFDRCLKIRNWGPKQITGYIEQYFEQQPTQVSELQRRALRSSLQHLIRNRGTIQGWVQTPMNLFLLCLIWPRLHTPQPQIHQNPSPRASSPDPLTQGARIPSLSALYDHVVHFLMRRYLFKVRNQDLQPQTHSLVLFWNECPEEYRFFREIAFTITKNNRRTITPMDIQGFQRKYGTKNDPINMIKKVGLLRAINGSEHEFVHSTFQEYFTACHLFWLLLSPSPSPALEFLERYKYQTAVRSVIDFLAGILSQEPPKEFNSDFEAWRLGTLRFWDSMLNGSPDLVVGAQLALILPYMGDSPPGFSTSIQDWNQRTLSTVVKSLENESGRSRRFAVRILGQLDPTRIRVRFDGSSESIGLWDYIKSLLGRSDVDLNTKQAALYTLCQWSMVPAMTEEIVAILGMALRDPKSAVRQFAAHAAGQLSDTGIATDILVSALRDSDRRVTISVLQSLSQLAISSPAARLSLVHASQDLNLGSAVRAHAVHQLGTLKTFLPEILPHLEIVLKDYEEKVVMQAVQVLKEWSPSVPEAITHLGSIFHNPHGQIQAKEFTIGFLREPGLSLPQVIQTLSLGLDDPELAIRRYAVNVLCGVVRTSPSISIEIPQIWISLEKAVANTDLVVRQLAVTCLGGLSQISPRAVELLEFGAETQCISRAMVIVAFLNFNVTASPVIQLLIRFLNSGDNDSKGPVVIALGKLATNSPEVIPILIGLVDQAPPGLKNLALQALRRLTVYLQGAMAATQTTLDAAIDHNSNLIQGLQIPTDSATSQIEYLSNLSLQRIWQHPDLSLQESWPQPLLTERLTSIQSLGLLGFSSSEILEILQTAVPEISRGLPQILETSLCHDDPGIRRLSVSVLGYLSQSSPQAVTVLTKALKNPELEIQKAAIFTLRRVPQISTAVNAIGALLQDSELKSFAAGALFELDLADPQRLLFLERAVPERLEFAERALGDPVTQALAIHFLGEISGISPSTVPQCQDLLGRVLQGSDSRHKAFAVKIVAQLAESSPEALPLLAQASQDPDPNVRSCAVQGVNRVLNHPQAQIRGLMEPAVRVLCQILQNNTSMDTTLASLNLPAETISLRRWIGVVQHPDPRQSSLQTQAGEALQNLGLSEANRETLDTAWKEDQSIRGMVVSSLGRLKTEELDAPLLEGVIQSLVAAWEDLDSASQASVEESLAQLCTEPESLDVLISIINLKKLDHTPALELMRLLEPIRLCQALWQHWPESIAELIVPITGIRQIAVTLGKEGITLHTEGPTLLKWRENSNIESQRKMILEWFKQEAKEKKLPTEFLEAIMTSSPAFPIEGVTSSPISFTAIILCAKYEEAYALRQVLKGRGCIEYERAEGSLAYHTFKIKDRDGRDFNLQVYCPRDQAGSVMTAVDVVYIIDRLSPHWVFMTGICAGNPQKTVLGDVIVADRVVDARYGKIDSTGIHHDIRPLTIDAHLSTAIMDTMNALRGLWNQYIVIPRPVTRRCQAEVILKLLHQKYPIGMYIPDIMSGASEIFKSKEECRDILQSLLSIDPPRIIRFPDGKYTLNSPQYDELTILIRDTTFPKLDAKEPEVRRGTLLTDVSAVRADFDEKKWIQYGEEVGARDLYGLEMEGVGLYGAMERLNQDRNPRIKFMLIKSVSDYAGTKKDDQFHEYGKQASGVFVYEFLRRYGYTLMSQDPQRASSSR